MLRCCPNLRRLAYRFVVDKNVRALVSLVLFVRKLRCNKCCALGRTWGTNYRYRDNSGKLGVISHSDGFALFAFPSHDFGETSDGSLQTTVVMTRSEKGKRLPHGMHESSYLLFEISLLQ